MVVEGRVCCEGEGDAAVCTGKFLGGGEVRQLLVDAHVACLAGVFRGEAVHHVYPRRVARAVCLRVDDLGFFRRLLRQGLRLLRLLRRARACVRVRIRTRSGCGCLGGVRLGSDRLLHSRDADTWQHRRRKRAAQKACERLLAPSHVLPAHLGRRLVSRERLHLAHLFSPFALDRVFLLTRASSMSRQQNSVGMAKKMMRSAIAAPRHMSSPRSCTIGLDEKK